MTHASIRRWKISEYSVELCLLGLLLLQVITLAWMINLERAESSSRLTEAGVGRGQQMRIAEPTPPAITPKLSTLRGPQIDAEGAMAFVDQTGRTVPIRFCDTLPTNVWVFLIVAYVILLSYNLVSGFRPGRPVQWFWEGVLTTAALLAWVVWEECRGYAWYPLAIVQFGITLYALYLLSYRRRTHTIDYDHNEEPVW